MTPKIFDGLHGNIILVCSICGQRHVPRCKMPEAVSLGALGGKSRSKAKIEASKANGKLGGRPRKLGIVDGKPVYSTGKAPYFHSGKDTNGNPV